MNLDFLNTLLSETFDRKGTELYNDLSFLFEALGAIDLQHLAATFTLSKDYEGVWSSEYNIDKENSYLAFGYSKNVCLALVLVAAAGHYTRTKTQFTQLYKKDYT